VNAAEFQNTLAASRISCPRSMLKPARRHPADATVLLPAGCPARSDDGWQRWLMSISVPSNKGALVRATIATVQRGCSRTTPSHLGLCRQPPEEFPQLHTPVAISPATTPPPTRPWHRPHAHRVCRPPSYPHHHTCLPPPPKTGPWPAALRGNRAPGCAPLAKCICPTGGD